MSETDDDLARLLGSLKRVRGMMKEMAAATSHGERPVAYSQGRHVAINGMLAFMLDRIGRLEAEPRLRHVGTWNARRAYKPGEVVTHDGSAWTTDVESIGCRPGQGGTWRLIVKRGKDAR